MNVLEDRLVEITTAEQNKEKRNEDSLRDLWDNVKHTNIHIIGVPEGEEREKGPEKICEEIRAGNFPNKGNSHPSRTENFPNMGNSHPSPGSTESPIQVNPRRNTPRHIVIELTKIKEKMLKATREKQQITYNGTPIRPTADFSAETLQGRREWHNIFKVMKGKNLQPRTLYPARLSLGFDGESKALQTSKS